jgi:hypothetical protein
MSTGRVYLAVTDVVFVGFFAYVVWCWFRWAKSSTDIYPRWRAFTAIVGYGFATASTALSAFMFVHAKFTGGYPYYHPVELFCIRVGTLTALIGLVATIIGKGKLHLPTGVVSGFNLLIWFTDAIAQ